MKRTAFAVAVLVAASVVLAQTTVPAVRNPFAPSSPQGAAEALSAAMAAGDAPAIRSILDAKTDAERKMVDAMVRMSQAIAKVRGVAIKRYGDEQAKAVLGDPDVSAYEEHNRLESALLTVERDRAVLTFPDAGSDSIVLRRSSASADRWVIPLADKAANLPPGELETRADDLDAAAKVVEEVAALCEGGKWATPSDVLIAIQERMLKSQESRLPATTTAPATAPVGK